MEKLIKTRNNILFATTMLTWGAFFANTFAMYMWVYPTVLTLIIIPSIIVIRMSKTIIKAEKKNIRILKEVVTARNDSIIAIIIMTVFIIPMVIPILALMGGGMYYATMHAIIQQTEINIRM